LYFFLKAAHKFALFAKNFKDNLQKRNLEKKWYLLSVSNLVIKRDRKFPRRRFFEGENPIWRKRQTKWFSPPGFHQKKIEFPGLVGGEIQEHLKFPRKSNFPWENKTSWNLLQRHATSCMLKKTVKCSFLLNFSCSFSFRSASNDESSLSVSCSERKRMLKKETSAIDVAHIDASITLHTNTLF
jgi:hypothetical protein